MKTTLFQLRPEVPGVLGPLTVWEKPTPGRPQGPMGVARAEFELHEWRGACLFTASPVYAVTLAVRQAIEGAGLTGAAFQDMRVTVGEPYASSGSPTPSMLPPICRLLPQGVVEADFRRPVARRWDGLDFNLANIGLVVSERAKTLLEGFGLGRCVVRPLTFASPDAGGPDVS